MGEGGRLLHVNDAARPKSFSTLQQVYTFDTVSCSNVTLQQAVEAFMPGDVIVVRALTLQPHAPIKHIALTGARCGQAACSGCPTEKLHCHGRQRTECVAGELPASSSLLLLPLLIFAAVAARC